MRKNRRSFGLGYRLFLLLFFLCGAVLLHLVPAVGLRFAPSSRMTGLLMLLPALLAGSMLGVYIIPFGAMLLGMLCMQKLSLLGNPSGEGLGAWLLALLPLALLTPVYFVLAFSGMELSDACMADYLRADGRKRQLLLRRQLLIASCVAAAVAVSYFLV